MDTHASHRSHAPGHLWFNARVRNRRSWQSRLRKAARTLRRARLPRAAWALLAAGALAAATLAYQLARKPTELLGLVVPPAPKPPESTWAEYGALFDAHSTELVPPELLAALAQLESGGDPLARTYWRWRWTWNPLDVYGPASSAVGLLQMTDGNYADARRLCIHAHAVAEEGSWRDPGACWFNALYLRTVPSHAIEMTAAWLHRSVAEILAEQRIARATPAQKKRLAAVVHLCGRQRAAAFARRGFWVLPGERCGDHDVARYVARVAELTATFARLGARR
jgi:hypothetical protein